MNDRLPTFLYIGPDKAGSTWIHEILIKHPQVWLSPAKDLYYFDRYYDRGLDWYRRQFATAGDQPVIGEICQDYLSCPEAPQRISETLGRPRLMVSLREPASRAYSSYQYMLKMGQRPGSFAEALRSRPELLDHGRYGTQLSRYLDVFGRDALYLGVFDDLKHDPQAFIDDVLAWLGLEPWELDEQDRGRRLPASRPRSALLARSARSAADVVRRFDGAGVVGTVKRSPLVQRALYTPLAADAPGMPDEDAAWIRSELREEIERVDRAFGTDLIGRWGW